LRALESALRAPALEPVAVRLDGARHRRPDSYIDLLAAFVQSRRISLLEGAGYRIPYGCLAISGDSRYWIQY